MTLAHKSFPTFLKYLRLSIIVFWSSRTQMCSKSKIFEIIEISDLPKPLDHRLDTQDIWSVVSCIYCVSETVKINDANSAQKFCQGFEMP